MTPKACVCGHDKPGHTSGRGHCTHAYCCCGRFVLDRWVRKVRKK